MTVTIAPGAFVSLFVAMALLAAVPGVSVMTVVARAAAGGFRHGAAAAAGIAVADAVFILAAIFGLAILADAMGGLFILVEYLGAAFLVWLGISLWRAGAETTEGAATARPVSLFSSFLAGFLLTFGDQKAILFYLGFLPAFLDMGALGIADAAAVIALATVAILSVKLAWAALAAGAAAKAPAGALRLLNRAAAILLVITGLYLALTA